MAIKIYANFRFSSRCSDGLDVNEDAATVPGYRRGASPVGSRYLNLAGATAF
jgi:hypothetical protein